jgi:hypothetical protein
MLGLTHQQDNFPIDTRLHRSKNFVSSDLMQIIATICREGYSYSKHTSLPVELSKSPQLSNCKVLRLSSS